MVKLSENSAICDTCGEVIKRVPSSISHSEVHFCNRVCRNKWQSKMMMGNKIAHRDSNFDLDKYRKDYYKINKECILKRQKFYYEANKEMILEREERYRANNKIKIAKRAKKYRQAVLCKDPTWKIMNRLRARIHIALKATNVEKANKTINLIGCSIEEFKSHIESLFKAKMNWENYGKNGWVLDHIRPCSSFDLSNPIQQKECFNYKNIQPLWEWENIEKSDKLLS